jgi:hypothetical protein
VRCDQDQKFYSNRLEIEPLKYRKKKREYVQRYVKAYFLDMNRKRNGTATINSSMLDILAPIITRYNTTLAEDLTINAAPDERKVQALLTAQRSQHPQNEVGTIQRMFYFNRIGSMDELMQSLETIYQRQDQAFKISAFPGILKYKPSEEAYAILRPNEVKNIFRGRNNTISPIAITDRKSLQRAKTQLFASMSPAIEEQNRTETGWVHVAVGVYAVMFRV